MKRQRRALTDVVKEMTKDVVSYDRELIKKLGHSGYVNKG